MFVLKKLITPFLLPPGVFVFILLVLGGRAWLKKNRMLSVIYTCIGIALWMTSSGLTANLLMRGLESGISMGTIPQSDVIIMLGGGVYSQSPDMTGLGAPTGSTLERLVTAARLHRRTGIPILLSGGPVFAHTASSARIGARFLMDLGIEPQNLIIEDQSRDTYENALYSAQICRQRGFQKPMLLTSASHIRRSLLSFKAVGLEVTPYPCGSTTWPGQKLHWDDFLPSYHGLATVGAALHEWIGLFYYKIRY
jgi:uncharacterized SAM-binding protein YcdF (DUF218 family)